MAINKQFTSNMGGKHVASLTLNTDQGSQVYTPFGTDTVVDVSSATVFEYGDVTYAQVAEAVSAHRPIWLHISGQNVNYMVPYVGGASDTGYRFAIANTQNNSLQYWLLKSDDTWDTGSYAAAANDPTITFQQNGSTCGTITLNQSNNQTINFQTSVSSHKLAQATGSSSANTYLDFSLALPRTQYESNILLLLDLFSLSVTYDSIDRSITQYFDSVDFYLGDSDNVARFNYWRHDFSDPWPNGIASKGRIATQHLGGSFATNVDRVTIRLNKATGADLTSVTANGVIYLVQQ